MTGGLIKAERLSDYSDVRSFAVPAANVAAPQEVVDEVHEALRRRIETLEREAREKENAMSTLRSEMARTVEEAKSVAWQAGFDAAEDKQAERCRSLELSLQRTEAMLAERLAELDRLAPLLAQECLEIILADRAFRAEIVQNLLKTQVAKLDRQMLAGIELSQVDFADQTMLDEIGRRCGASHVSILARSDLPSGACVMRLRLGSVEIGIEQQWGVLRDVLRELAAPEVVP